MKQFNLSQKLQLTTQDLHKGYKDINFRIPLLYLKDCEMFREWREEIEGEEISVKIARVKAFMYALRYGEGTLGERGYKTIVGGGTFDDFSKHPNIYIKKLKSTAAGAYQYGQRTETMENFMKYYNKHLEEELQGISNLAISNEELLEILHLRNK